MADIPPVSDPQIAAIIQQNAARRKRAVLIFAVVAAVLVLGLGGSAFYSSGQAKKKRNVAYSRVVKCLFGTPLAQGEAPMSRVRSAWRARILTPKGKGGPTLEDQEAAKTKEWPNRCVAQMISFTDTLKDIGEMKEGEKDLGFYLRELSKQTAGDNWKNVDTYQAAVESFVTEAQKGNFDFVDVADVQAPELVDASTIDTAFPKTSEMEDLRVDANGAGNIIGSSVRFFVPAGKGKPARFCSTADGKELTYSDVVAGGLPPEASGTPWILGSDDGAPALLAFGRRGGVVNGSSLSTGVFRSGDGFALIPPDAFYVAGGYSSADGSALLLLKDAKEPEGDHFKVGRLAAGAKNLQIDPVRLDEWDEHPTTISMFGSYVLWVTNKEELKARALDGPKDAPAIMIATLPGPIAHAGAFGGKSPIQACRTKTATVIGLRVRADALEKLLIVHASPTGFGKVIVTDDGELSCTDDAGIVLSSDAISTCTEAGCNGTKRISEDDGRSVMIDTTLVRMWQQSGLLIVEWEKDGKSIAKKVYDAQMKGTVLLGESKLGHVAMIAQRGYGLLSVRMADGAVEKERFARVDAAGTITPVTVK